jgi:5-methylcytosine-specific restriction endonuclease McrA
MRNLLQGESRCCICGTFSTLQVGESKGSRFMREKVMGTCHLCGECGELSFEHSPPRKAFNNNPLLFGEMEWIRSGGDIEAPKVRKGRRGAGAYTLCKRCNNNTGAWYGESYVSLARQGMEYLRSVRSASFVHLPFHIHPLRVMKQVACMFMSANGPTFQAVQSELARFVLNREARHLPNHVRVYGFYTVSDRSRSSGVSGLIEGILSDSPKNRLVSEVTFPPFGFLMTFDSPPPDDRLADITYFADEYGYDDEVTLWLRFPVLPIYTYFPADYRSREKVLRDAGRWP